MGIALATVLATLWTAGWEFALPSLTAFAMLRFWRRVGWREAMLISAGGLVWLMLFRLSGNRQAYFPFILYWASVAGLVWAKPVHRFLGAAVITGIFVAVRVVQDVTQAVLVKELIVAALALAISLPFVTRNAGMMRRSGAAMLAAIAAFAGLAV